MAEEKQETKETPLDIFRKKLRDNKDQVRETIMEGLKSTNSKVRSFAAKSAFKLRDHAFIKKNILPLVTSEKSKKVLRAVSSHLTRKELEKKIKSMIALKKAPTEKTTKTEPAEDAPTAETAKS